MRSSVSIAPPPGKPTFIYDGECGFCGRRVARWKQLTEGRVDFVPSQTSPFPEIPTVDYARSGHFVDRDGAVFSGSEAVFRMFACARGKTAWLWAYRNVPGFAPFSEFVYAKIATHRYPISRIWRF